MVVVTVQSKAEGRGLLTWVLVMVASAGDHVVVLHVATTTAATADKGEATEPLTALLRAYDGFCDLKQASSYGATHLILGVTTNSRHFGRSSSSSAAVAKYCTKSVPQSCSVHTISNGRVVYRRDGSGMHQQQQQPNQCISPIVETPWRIYWKLLSVVTMSREKA
ncbi:hypothetical protein ABZP36_034910 [Zizania latifolia]